jgi:small-conductance mechanosensitive channel
VVVREFDGTEAIIPNESVITSTVLNHSYSDQSVRVDLTVQVAYGTNLRQALDALQEIAREHPRVQKEPAPAALVRNFGESGIDLDLMVWIADPEAGRGNLRSELNLRIDEVFRQRGFEIPFPQRDLHIVSGALEPAAKGQV